MYMVTRENCVSSFHQVKDLKNRGPVHLRGMWEKELGKSVAMEDWDRAWVNSKFISICNRVQAKQLKSTAQISYLTKST